MSEEEKSLSTPFTVGEMLDMQRTLQEKYKAIWEGDSPETGINKILWMVGEIGEVSDVLKKRGISSVLQPGETRDHFVEEMADVLMYYHDVMLCFGITEEELKKAYVSKFEHNMKRW